MSRIPKIEKFRGDNSADFKIWITQFEGYLRALDLENDKKVRYFVFLFRRDCFFSLV